MKPKTIQKIIKQYRRGKAGYVQRIDFNKSDNLKEGALIHIMTEKQLKNLEQDFEKEIAYLREQNIKYVLNIEEKNMIVLDLNKELSRLNKEVANSNREIAKTLKEKDEIILKQTEKLNKAIDDKNNYKNTITALHLLLEKYKNRNILERLTNKYPSLDDDDQKLIKDSNI